MRPSSRHFSSGRYGEERSPRSAQPRPNRDRMDRAWESGARPQHADYRTRDTNGQGARGNGQRDRQSSSPSAQYGRNNRKPYRQDNNPRFDRSSPINRRAHDFDEGRSNDRRNYSDRPYRQDRYENGRVDEGRSNDRRNYSESPYRPNRYENGRKYEQRPHYEGRNQGRGYQQRNSERNNEGDRNYRQRNSERNNEGARNYQQRNFAQDNEGRRDYQQRNSRNSNPRWQSRPGFQRQYGSRRQEADEHPSQEDEQFEGDYERYNAPRHSEGRFQGNAGRRQYRKPEREERHVTRLPDGRVLKGSRPAQRKNARFWKDVTHDTEELLSPIETSSDQVTTNKVPGEQEKPTPAKDERQRTQGHPRKASTLGRGKKGPTKKAGTKSPKPRSSGPKPSQRGFKWPTSQE